MVKMSPLLFWATPPPPCSCQNPLQSRDSTRFLRRPLYQRGWRRWAWEETGHREAWLWFHWSHPGRSTEWSPAFLPETRSLSTGRWRHLLRMRAWQFHRWETMTSSSSYDLCRKRYGFGCQSSLQPIETPVPCAAYEKGCIHQQVFLMPNPQPLTI